MKTFDKLFFCGFGIALTLLVTPFFERARANATRSSCQSNLKHIGIAFKQYVRDYDERYPLTSNWERALRPYRDIQPEIWRCPDRTFTFVYNAHLEKINEDQVDNQQQITLVYEGATTRRTDKGQSWFAFAHGNGSNVVYMDAHVKWETKKPRFSSPEMSDPEVWKIKRDAEFEAQRKSR